jgi:hypothetical protein
MDPVQKTSSSHKKKIRLYGHEDSPKAYAIRDFLSRSVVHFDSIKLPRNGNYRELLGLDKVEESQLPIVDMPDGERLFAPTIREIADRLGWITKPRLKEYDLSIYGAGHWQLADGDRVITYKTYYGTHEGDFLGIAPTHRKIHFETVDVMRVRDGKITDHWGVGNLLSLMQQIGGWTPPSATEANERKET